MTTQDGSIDVRVFDARKPNAEVTQKVWRLGRIREGWSAVTLEEAPEGSITESMPHLVWGGKKGGEIFPQLHATSDLHGLEALQIVAVSGELQASPHRAIFLPGANYSFVGNSKLNPALQLEQSCVTLLRRIAAHNQNRFAIHQWRTFSSFPRIPVNKNATERYLDGDIFEKIFLSLATSKDPIRELFLNLVLIAEKVRTPSRAESKRDDAKRIRVPAVLFDLFEHVEMIVGHAKALVAKYKAEGWMISISHLEQGGQYFLGAKKLGEDSVTPSLDLASSAPLSAYAALAKHLVPADVDQTFLDISKTDLVRLLLSGTLPQTEA